jgi:hypothetical protein
MENLAEVSFSALQSVAEHVTLRNTKKIYFDRSDQWAMGGGGGREDGKFSLLGSHCGDRSSFVSEFGCHLESICFRFRSIPADLLTE